LRPIIGDRGRNVQTCRRPINNPEAVDQGQDQINGDIVKEFARMVLESPEAWRSAPGAEGGEDDKI
jgi:hypothetical protein